MKIILFILGCIIYAEGNSLNLIKIHSSLDGKLQSAFIYKASKPNRPLIVSLHEWSGTYTGRDKLAQLAIDNDINYIYPNFRGANNKKEACCSKKVISDIDDSISYMLKYAMVDKNNITITGVSGGYGNIVHVF